MNDYEKWLWKPKEKQDFLMELIQTHQKRLLEVKTPQADRWNEEFTRKIGPVIDPEVDVIDGNAVYDILRETGGADYALDLYRRYSDTLNGKQAGPAFADVADELGNMPELSPEIIGGILRRGHQMLIAGGSKTSKSFLSLELAISIATGQDWLNTYPCKQGRVLYVNGEIDRASCDRRIAAILENMKVDREDLRGKMSVLSLRGFEMTTGQLSERINRAGGFDLVIIDPVYTMGDVADENNAAEVRKFLREVGELSTETGAAVVCIHHHSKGQQGGKRAIDRASGSGVFGRWFDAVLDLSALHIPDGVAEQSRTPESIPMRLEFDLRDFKQPKPLSIWWHYPVHIPDHSGELDGLLVDGDPRGNLVQYQQGESEEARQEKRDSEMERAIGAIVADGREPTVKAVADELGVSDRAVRKWLEGSSKVLKNGRILERNTGK